MAERGKGVVLPPQQCAYLPLYYLHPHTIHQVALCLNLTVECFRSSFEFSYIFGELHILNVEGTEQSQLDGHHTNEQNSDTAACGNKERGKTKQILRVSAYGTGRASWNSRRFPNGYSARRARRGFLPLYSEPPSWSDAG